MVPEAAIETHEGRAEQFLWITAITLAAASAVLIVRRPAALQTLTAVTVLRTFLAAGAALRVGHAGGQLVYVHNAAAAYAPGKKTSPKAGADAAVTPARESNAVPKRDDEK